MSERAGWQWHNMLASPTAPLDHVPGDIVEPLEDAGTWTWMAVIYSFQLNTVRAYYTVGSVCLN